MEFFQKKYWIILLPFVSLLVLVGAYAFLTKVMYLGGGFYHEGYLDWPAFLGFYILTIALFFNADALWRKEMEQENERASVLVAIRKSIFFALWFVIFVVILTVLNFEIWLALLSGVFLVILVLFTVLNIISGFFHFSSPNEKGAYVGFLRMYLFSIFVLGHWIILAIHPLMFMF